MPKKRYTPEEIVAKLRQVDVLIGQGKALEEAVKSIEVTDTTYHRWRSFVTACSALFRFFGIFGLPFQADYLSQPSPKTPGQVRGAAQLLWPYWKPK
jgi:ABC-type antimicrobial peptide transport system permease subunit